MYIDAFMADTACEPLQPRLEPAQLVPPFVYVLKL